MSIIRFSTHIMKGLERSFAARAQDFKQDDSGVVFIEAGVVMAFLMLLSLFIWDIGSLFIRQTEITNAVRAGSQYALVKRPVAGDLEPVIDAVKNAAPDGTSPTVNAELYCLCDGGVEIVCSDACGGGEERQYFLTIDYADEYEFLFKFPGASKTIALGDSLRVRLK